jgi:adenine phosphoribosyltransferase
LSGGALRLERYIRDVPDFPIPGILYRDITPLLASAEALGQAVQSMSEPWRERGVDLVASMEARGFIFGAGIALRIGAGFVPVRKAGKLPWRTREVRYSLEYGTDILHMHEDAVTAGQKVLVVDDLIATGGTASAVVELVENLGGEVVGVQFLIELSDLKGRDLLRGRDVRSVIIY